ncbi:MAG: DUF616 domain-containing protein [Nitrospina sp.]|nr:DUF616 domain-containing protein [Nitrospina sp.]
MKKNNFVVYTALFGDYDDLLDPVSSADCDYICFTDNPYLKSDIWKIKIVPADSSGKMMNRLYKIKPQVYLKNYQASLYVDSNIKISKDPIELFKKYLNSYKILAIKHVDRNSIYSEALSCMASGYVDNNLILKQMFYYADDGYPANEALTENRILFRSHNAPEIISLMELWWKELNAWVQRDQLCLCYAAWKLGIKIGYISENPRFKNDFFKWYPHKEYEKRIFYRLLRKLRYFGRWILIYPYFSYRIGIIGKVYFNKSS